MSHTGQTDLKPVIMRENLSIMLDEYADLDVSLHKQSPVGVSTIKIPLSSRT